MIKFLAQGFGSTANTPFHQYIHDLFVYRIVPLAIVGSIFMFAVGGFLIIFSGGDAGKINTGKEIITGTIVGLIMILLAQVILAAIDPKLANTIF